MMTTPAPTPSHKPLSNSQLFMMMVLASWTMLFGTFILSLGFARVRANVWPPPDITPLDAFLPSVATCAILASSVLIHLAYKAFQKESLQDFRFFWGLGTLLGVFFVVLQYFSLFGWYESGVRASTHLYSSAVYVWIILHAAHIAAGVLGLFYKWARPKSTESLQLWGWFWHFIGAVWIVMFPLLLW